MSRSQKLEENKILTELHLVTSRGSHSTPLRHLGGYWLGYNVLVVVHQEVRGFRE